MYRAVLSFLCLPAEDKEQRQAKLAQQSFEVTGLQPTVLTGCWSAIT